MAARIFEMSLRQARTSRIKTATSGPELWPVKPSMKDYTRLEGMRDINPNAPLDAYLVLTGPKGALVSSCGTLRPFCIAAVYRFARNRLQGEFGDRGVKIIGAATSVPATQWEARPRRGVAKARERTTIRSR